MWVELIYFPDINECQGSNECSTNAECINTIGDYECKCNKGYVGNGLTCEG